MLEKQGKFFAIQSPQMNKKNATDQPQSRSVAII